MRVMIVDDEAPARKRLRRMLELQPEIEIVAEASHGAQALDLAKQYSPALVLMDIQMPGMNGLDAARQMAAWDHPPAVVFCTAYDEHALAAFEVAALDYLLKPIEQVKLEKALQRAEKLTQHRIDEAVTAVSPHVLVTTAQGVERLALADVYYFKAEQKYVVAVHSGGEALLRESLQQLEQAWGQYLIRAHRNTLIARDCLRGVVRDGARYRALLRGIEDEPVISRRHLQEVKAALADAG